MTQSEHILGIPKKVVRMKQNSDVIPYIHNAALRKPGLTETLTDLEAFTKSIF